MTERYIIVDHVLFVVEDFPASRRLYTAALAPLGMEELYEEPNCISYGRQQLDDFSICEGPRSRPPRTSRSTRRTGKQVDAFFDAALAAGATVRGEPGVWIQYSPRYYGAFVNDLHGNNVEAVFHSPEPITDAPERHGVP